MKNFRKYFLIPLLLCIKPSFANDNIINERTNLFKKSNESISIIKKLIKLEDYDSIIREGKFIYEWSQSIPLYFPEGTQASMENGSDASSDIWVNFTDFINRAEATERASFELINSASKKNLNNIKISFKKLMDSCNSCHRSYRN